MTATYLYYSYIIEDLNLQTFFHTLTAYSRVFIPKPAINPNMTGTTTKAVNALTFFDKMAAINTTIIRTPISTIFILVLLFLCKHLKKVTYNTPHKNTNMKKRDRKILYFNKNIDGFYIFRPIFLSSQPQNVLPQYIPCSLVWLSQVFSIW